MLVDQSKKMAEAAMDIAERWASQKKKVPVGEVQPLRSASF
jgi:hypothetical protein